MHATVADPNEVFLKLVDVFAVGNLTRIIKYYWACRLLRFLNRGDKHMKVTLLCWSRRKNKSKLSTIVKSATRDVISDRNYCPSCRKSNELKEEGRS